MKGRVKSITRKINRLASILGSHHTGAYAAQAAYFFVLSLIPIILLLLTMVQFTPVTRQDVMSAVTQVFPTTVEGLISSIVDQVYRQSSTIIPVTIIVALWSAGKGVLAMTSGMNLIYENTETRNYFYLRLRASFYTVIFLLAIVLSLSLSVFGNSISIIVYKHAPVLTTIMDFLIRIRTLLTLVVLTLFWDMVYKYLPNRTNLSKTTMKQQLPGAVFTPRMAVNFLYIFRLSGYFHRIFQYVRQPYNNYTDHAVAVCLHVCHPAWRRTECPAGRPGGEKRGQNEKIRKSLTIKNLVIQL